MDLIGAEPARFRAIRQVADLARDRSETLRLGAADHRGEESLVIEIHRDAEVDVAVHHETVPIDARVEMRELGERVDDGAGDEREVGEREALGGTELGLHGRSGRIDVGVVDLHHAEGVRRDGLALHHVTAGELSDLGQRNHRVAIAGEHLRR